MPPVQLMATRGYEVFAAVTTIVSPTSQTAAYMRIAAMTMAAYDWVITLKPEYRLYQRHRAFSRAVVLFVGIRYISIAAIVTSNVGFFGSGFSALTCHRYQIVAPLLKMAATLVSQLIISIRAYAISRKARWVFWALSILFVLSCVPEALGNIWQRKAVQNSQQNCTSGNLPHHKIAWVHYLAAVVFDTVAMSIASFYLYSPTRATILPSKVSGLSRVMLQEGLFYFIALTAANIVNLVMFLMSDISVQSSAAVFGQAITMIMSQRIILNLQEWTNESSQLLSQSFTTPNYPMNLLHNRQSVPPTPSTGTPRAVKHLDVWQQPPPPPPSVPAIQKTHGRKGSLGVVLAGNERVHVVVEQEVKYDENTSISDRSGSDSPAKK